MDIQAGFLISCVCLAVFYLVVRTEVRKGARNAVARNIMLRERLSEKN